MKPLTDSAIDEAIPDGARVDAEHDQITVTKRWLHEFAHAKLMKEAADALERMQAEAVPVAHALVNQEKEPPRG